MPFSPRLTAYNAFLRERVVPQTQTAQVLFADVVQDVRQLVIFQHKLEPSTWVRSGQKGRPAEWYEADLIDGVSVCALLFQPVGELLVGLVVCRDVEYGRRRHVCAKTILSFILISFKSELFPLFVLA